MYTHTQKEWDSKINGYRLNSQEHRSWFLVLEQKTNNTECVTMTTASTIEDLFSSGDKLTSDLVFLHYFNSQFDISRADDCLITFTTDKQHGLPKREEVYLRYSNNSCIKVFFLYFICTSLKGWECQQFLAETRRKATKR